SRKNASVSNGSSTGTGLRLMPGKRVVIAALSLVSGRGAGRPMLLRADRAGEPSALVRSSGTSDSEASAAGQSTLADVICGSCISCADDAESAAPIRTLAISPARKTAGAKISPGGGFWGAKIPEKSSVVRGGSREDCDQRVGKPVRQNWPPRRDSNP